MKICISSGHGAKIDGAVDVLDEHKEAVRVVNRTAEFLRAAGVEVSTFEDLTSTDQQTNLETIVNWHNAQGPHDLDVSIHFNDTGEGRTSQPIGTECWYYSQAELANAVAEEMAGAAGLIDRGAKKSTGLYFLAHTNEPAILDEVVFVNSTEDARLYNEHFDLICEALAVTLAGKAIPETPLPPTDQALLNVTGRCSWFGGPHDFGVSADEPLAFLTVQDAPHLFLQQQPPSTTGAARRLNPGIFYLACRFDYSRTSKAMLADPMVQALVRANGREFLAWPADWGPHEDTGRVADLSPALMTALGLETDDIVQVIYPASQSAAMA